MIALLMKNKNVILFIALMLLMIVLAYWVLERLIREIDDSMFR